MADTMSKWLYDQIAQYLTEMGLGDLFVNSTDGTPGGWLWDQITNGLDNEAALMISLEATPQFQQRYGIITELRQRAANGEPVTVPSVAAVREYEASVSSLMRQAGLPTWMYDSYTDAQALMRQNLSVSEVEQRLGNAWERVTNSDPAVRETFQMYYGMDGDAALAAMFLDPNRTMASLERASRAAYAGGMGKTLDVQLSQAQAERVAGLPTTEAGILQDLRTTAQIQHSGLLNETLGERAKDLNDATAINAGIFGEGDAQAQLERRTIERRAQQAAVPGGALRDQRGVSGLGNA
ncbi:MAG: hypothetical protein KDH16_20985 [Rhodocyclaceae bacterium]|nr:hypothetical protein [Rhodocyclaceae bacterium]